MVSSVNLTMIQRNLESKLNRRCLNVVRLLGDKMAEYLG